MIEVMQRVRTPEDFWQLAELEGDCLVWTGRLDRDGYGKLTWDGRETLAHRLAFFLREGRWPHGLLLHGCRSRRCLVHTREGTQAENVAQRRLDGTDPNVNKTRCPQGHTYDDANTGRSLRPSGVGRYCRTCKRDRSRARRARRA